MKINPSSVLRPPSSDLRPQTSDLRPQVSICLPTLNARRFLEPRMETILAQTLTDWELIVCDSYSDDGTWEYFQQFKHDPRVRLYQVPKEGLYAGWNEGLRRCRGEYVYIATADDTCQPDLLEKMVGALGKVESRKSKVEIGTEDGGKVESRKSKVERDAEDGEKTEYRTQNSESRNRESVSRRGAENSENQDISTFDFRLSTFPELPADIAVCNFDYIDENGDIIVPLLPPAGAFYGEDRYRAHRRSGYREFLVHLLIGTSWTTMTAVVFRRSLLEKTGLFVTDVGPLADRFWAYKSALNSDSIVVPETLATWRQHSAQGTSPGRNRSVRNLRRLWRRTVEVVRECVPLMPGEWTRDPAFLEKLLWAERRHYYDRYHLNRTTLRMRPYAFFKGLLKAVALEPGYLARRLCSGLAWEADARMLEDEYLRRLMQEWDV